MTLTVNSQPPGDIVSQSGQVNTGEPAPERMANDPSEINPGQQDSRPIIAQENTDPGKIRLVNRLSKGLFARLARWMRRLMFTPDLNAEERALLSDTEKRKLIEKQLIAESKVGENRLKNCLTRLGICSITIKKDRKIIKPVRFWRILAEENAIWFGVDMKRLPHGVSVLQLIDQETVTNLSMAVEHKVSCRWNEKAGVWYCMERASGTFGIPNHVNLAEMWNKIPASRDNLTIPIGVTFNGKTVYDSLDNMVHLLIAGTTGGGKSNFLNVILCTLIRRNRPDQLELLMVDLKGGLEFNYYEGIPHLRKLEKLAPTGIINERNGVAPLLNWVIEEGEHRMKILLEGKAKNIGEYNAHRKGKNRMPQMVVVIDEWADVKLGKDGQKTEDRLANAVQRMRAMGIHVILCTQVPQSQVIGTMIKANLPAKFAFSCAGLQGSMAILNTGHAVNLQPRGRCIYQFQEETQIQTPFIPKSIILETVQAAITGHAAEATAKHDVTPEEIREWALRDNNGYLNQSVVMTRYKGRGITQDELYGWLKSWDDKTYTIGSSQFTVEPGNNRRARRLVAVNDSNPTQPDPQETTNV